MSPGHSAPTAQRTPQFRFASCLPQLSMQPPTPPGTAASPPHPPGAAPDLSIGTTEVLVSAQDIVPGPKISTPAEKAVMFPLPSWPPRGYPVGSLLGGGFVLTEPEDGAHGSPPGKLMLSAENIGNFPLNALRPGHAGGEARPQDALGAGSEPGQGRGPGSAVSPPRCPGPRSASGTGHTADVPSGPPQTGLASAIAPQGR
jgi:hypothetical protein